MLINPKSKQKNNELSNVTWNKYLPSTAIVAELDFNKFRTWYVTEAVEETSKSLQSICIYECFFFRCVFSMRQYFFRYWRRPEWTHSSTRATFGAMLIHFRKDFAKVSWFAGLKNPTHAQSGAGRSSSALHIRWRKFLWSSLFVVLVL